MNAPVKVLLQSAAATVLFAGLHSLFASAGAKRVFVRHRKAGTPDLYRIAYNAGALVSSAKLFLWLRQLDDDRVLYQVRGPASHAMRMGQAVAVVQLARCIAAAGFRTFVGFPVQGESIDAQGPALREDGTLIVTGPFRTQRHPTNFWPVVLLWMQPRMTYAGFAFSTVASLYLYVGSLHQDRRLNSSYGAAYDQYRASGIPLFFPLMSKSVLKRLEGDVNSIDRCASGVGQVEAAANAWWP